MARLEARILAYLEKWPSVGILRISIDLGEDLNNVMECLARLHQAGLVEVKWELGVANLRPWLEEVRERQATAVRRVEGPKAAASILDFMGGGGGGR